ncbi:polynucleotide phosphorylase [Denitrobacterium detoxificans]|uniref:Polyribonucleotide nucleotidyltransferase n=1 Tax=Denitrobacterium detoxificans TaxID=79604 RepID=A0A172RYC6_9ACTN|nr:polyribonucleotide nucleotidyltransferase [Denitrobacterium detoxificans]ANE22718.1 polynucleotide phosphorylase [Denitrobacterium detoxificans]SEO87977.1 polyribonucleotide nucleotidyltransferase [Denitrobacterium detoxificans]
MEKIVEEFELYGKKYRFETGELAKQATGAVLVTQGDTTCLVTAVVSKEEKDYDFFPLTVDFMEKMYAVGRIPGGYLKREGKASDKGTLTARLIDRPIRPGFPDGFKNEVHIVATTLVVDGDNAPDCICVNGASAALLVGGAPFDGPAACVRVGRNPETGDFICNPSYDELEESDLNLTIAGTADYISMVEAGAKEISEEDMLAAMNFGQKAIAEFCAAQQRFLDKVNPQPLEYKVHQADPSIAERVDAHFDEMSAALHDADKLSRIGKVEELKASIKANDFSEEEQAAWGSDIAAACKALEKRAMRRMVIETGERADGRTAKEIRPLYIRPGYLPRVHGSGLFQRGQTQALSVCTLGTLREGQRLDTIDPAEGKRYMHQYNFPPYCTGEVGRMGAPKRREVGHGALAERALLPVLPDEDTFPYAIRVVSEVLESNGSSSMASTCGSTLALMDAGVPISAPVSGIAMGLIKEGDDVVILSDIQGLEDFLGDMDFKVTGTENGITALQMDNKARGLSTEILGRALAQAKEGRAFILEAMLKEIPAPRSELSEFAPRIETIKIPVDKICDVIGTGGKVIRGLQDETGATIEVEEDGTVHIAAVEGPAGEAAKQAILDIVKEPEVGEIFEGEIVGIKDFGAFVKLTASKDGLLHISRMANGRVGRVEDVLNLGDKVKVQVIEVGENGKISLDRLEKPDAPEGSARPRREDRGERSEHGDRPRRRPGDRGGDRGGRGGHGRDDHRKPRSRNRD